MSALSPEVRQAIALVQAYLRDEITYATLWERYDSFFRACSGLDEESFSFLEGIWGDLEVTTPIRSLIDDYPGHYLDENELQIVLAGKLKALEGRPGE